MFGKMMNRYYYGKSGKGDYSPDDLPKNRWQLFWEMLRVRFTGLVRLNLTYMLCWLPAIYVIGRGLLLMYNGLGAAQNIDGVLMLVNEAGEQLGTLGDLFNSILWQTLLLLIPCIAITGPFTAGISYVTRNWARDEHAFVWSDFKDAVKGNWKYGLLTSIITGLLPAMIYIGITTYSSMAAAQGMFWYVPCALLLVLGFIWFCMIIYIYPMIVTYDLKYKGILRNALLLTIGRLPMTVGLRLLTFVPVLIFGLFAFLLEQYIYFVLLLMAIYYIVMGYALSRFVCASYSNSVFDRYINSKIEGAVVNRGLYTEDDDDEENETDTAE